MLRQIAVGFFQVVSAFTFLIGLLAMALAAGVTSKYSLYSASAVQVTQVYSEGIYTALIGIGALLTTLVIQVIIYVSDTKQKADLQAVQTDVAEVKRLAGITANMVNTVRKNMQKTES